MKTIPLTQGKVALVDDEDYERVSQYKWRYDSGYVKMGHSSRNDMWRMAEFIMGLAPVGYIWEHKDLDGTNHQRSNLRLATRSQNGANRNKPKNNTTGYKGVKKLEYRGRVTWQARITVEGQAITIGTYDTIEKAADAYDKAAIKHFGEFARLNFPRQ